MKLDQQNYLVIGGSKGIGATIVNRLLNEGASVYTVSRNQTIKIDNSIQHHLLLDVTSDDISELQKFIPPILHGVVYCPGTIDLKAFGSLKLVDFQNDLNINFFGAIKVLQISLPALKKSETGSVVLFSTIATRIGLKFHSSIAAAKAALEGLAKSLAAEYASARIRFNVIAPSLTNTSLAANFLASEEKRQMAASRHPLQRFGEPADIAELAVFLLTPQSSWITGQVIGVDGGMSAIRPL